MKKQLFVLLVSLISLTGFAQGPCQAYFTTYQDTVAQELTLVDQSFNTDSTAINITAWTWTVSGMGVSYTYSVQNPVQDMSSMAPGSYVICLTITTGTSCTSTYCDSVFVGQQSGCQANYSYYNNAGTFYFNDNSFTTGGGNIVSWSWTFGTGTPSTSTQQNPVVTFQLNSTNPVSLTITTDNGCSDTYQTYVHYTDSMQCITYVDAAIYPVTTIGGTDGGIDLTVYGGTAPYNYQWNNGATTEDLFNVASGMYTATVWSADTTCPAYTVTAYIPEPYDSGIVYVDTLNTSYIDSCLTFVPDSFYISGISTTGSIVTTTWVLTGGGQTATITVDYTFTTYGAQVVVLSINCNPTKSLTTYMSYIYIHESVSIEETGLSITAYPNPSSDYINISATEAIKEIRLIAADGTLVKTFVNPENGINVSDVPVGVYYLSTISEKGVKATLVTILR